MGRDDIPGKVDTAARIRAILQLANAWLKPGSPWMKEAARQLPQTGLYSPAMTRACIHEMMIPFTQATLQRWTQSQPKTTATRSPKNILVILPSNVMAPAWQAATAIWLAGGKVIFKPSRREPVFSKLLLKSAQQIAPGILPCQVTDRIPRRLWGIIAYGSDSTVHQISRSHSRRLPCIGLGTQISLGILGKAASTLQKAAGKAARDVVLYETRGCLSPSACFVHGKSMARSFAKKLAEEIALLRHSLPPPPLTPHQQGENETFWQKWRYLASRSKCRILGDSVILIEKNHFPLEPVGIPRVIFIHAFTRPRELPILCGPWQKRTSTVALSSPRLQASLGKYFPAATRFCGLGEMHRPPPDWANGGIDLLQKVQGWISPSPRA